MAGELKAGRPVFAMKRTPRLAAFAEVMMGSGLNPLLDASWANFGHALAGGEAADATEVNGRNPAAIGTADAAKTTKTDHAERRPSRALPTELSCRIKERPFQPQPTAYFAMPLRQS
jgi:hypothetical protein